MKWIYIILGIANLIAMGYFMVTIEDDILWLTDRMANECLLMMD